MKLLLEFFSKMNLAHKQVPLGRWCSVNSNHDILSIKYNLKMERQKLKDNSIDPYLLNKQILERQETVDPKDLVASNYPFIDW